MESVTISFPTELSRIGFNGNGSASSPSPANTLSAGGQHSSSNL